MTKVRIAVIGIGNIGSGHAQYLSRGEVKNAELTAVCDVNPKRLQWVKENIGEHIKLFDNVNALLASKCMDGIIIAVPHYDHPVIAMKAFELGYHVLTEKPAGVYTKQVRLMNEAAKKSGKVFGIMFQARTRPLFQKARELVRSGELGEMKRVVWIITNWYRSQSYYDSGDWRATWPGEGGGVLINQCPHTLDIWQWICGVPVRVRSFCEYGKHRNIEVEDDVTAYVQYANGATGVFVTTTGDAPGTDRLEISGDRGKLVVEDNKLVFWRLRVPESQFNREYRGGFGQPECWKCEIPVKTDEPAHKIITQNWVEAINKGTELLSPGIEGINGLQISNAIHLSSWIDSWVDIPVNEDLYYEKLQDKINKSTLSKKKSESQISVIDIS